MKSPSLPQSPYGYKEKRWSDVIKNSYPAWDEPEVTIHPTSPIPSAERPGEGENVTGIPKTAVISFSEDKTVPAPGNDQEKTNGGTLQSDYTSDDGQKLPSAVLDVDPYVTTPPAANEPFAIIPDNQILQVGPRTGQPAGNHYTVKRGDTLAKIARKFYGDESEWRKIYGANKQVIANPDYIKPGIVLIIP